MNQQIVDGLVSTIIPVFNRAEMIVECIASVLAQDYRPIEIIVIDDGSDDETPTVLQALSLKHPEVNVFKQANSGPGRARELGLRYASGEFIQYLDSDDLLLPTKFSVLVNALNQQPECAVAYGKTERARVGEPLCGKATRRTGERHNTMFPLFFRSRWWCTSTPLYRASVLRDIGPWLSLSTEEDWEYDCRIASKGGQLAFVDEFVSIARLHDQHLSADGGTDPDKLRDRCVAQQHIYEHAKSFMALPDRASKIDSNDMIYFSKAVFLLARECAAQNLKHEARMMIKLSLNAVNGRGLSQRIFWFVAEGLGWRTAAMLVKALGK